MPIPANPAANARPLLICFSHLRWDFVVQRPQHLMRRFAPDTRVVFWEEPLRGATAPWLELRASGTEGVEIAVPHLPDGLDGDAEQAMLATLLDGLVADAGSVAVRWYYTPMMLPFSRDVTAACTVYDCMDELANFRFAPPELMDLERELLAAADCVFTGGYSLYEAKRDRHPRVRPFPSSVDAPHFARARSIANRRTHAPRLGFYGVIDERMDMALVAALADARPEWEIEMVGPVVKVDPAELPQRPNITYPGARSYDELPGTLAGWDVALMPFAINDSTRFISPTKTPEYLAAGRPVVSTAITDVIRHYGALDGVFIAEDADRFIAACDDALALARGPGDWLPTIDRALASMSWDRTVDAMRREIDDAGDNPRTARTKRDRYDLPVVAAVAAA